MNPLEGLPVRHKHDGSWCSGQPKRSVEVVVEVVVEILASLDQERALFREATNMLLDTVQTLVDISDRMNDQRAITVELLRQGGAAVRAEIEALQ